MLRTSVTMLQTAAASRQQTSLRRAPGLGQTFTPRFVRPLRPVRFKEEREFKESSPDLLNRRAAEEQVRQRQERQILHDQGEVISEQMVKSKPPVGAHPAEVKVPFWVPALTRRREVFMGRLAMVGLACACALEILIPGHPNVAQAPALLFQQAAIGVTMHQVSWLLALFSLYGLFSVAPWAPTWSPENLRDINERPLGPPITPISPLDYKKFFGVSKWGFTKANELFHGRLAMLGFAGILFQQWRMGGSTGPAPLEQVAMLFNLPASEAFYAAVPGVLSAFVALAVTLSALNGKLANPAIFDEEKDIY